MSRLTPRSYASTALLLAGLLVAGCQTYHGINGKLEVEIVSVPDKAEVYLFDEIAWYKAGKQHYEDARRAGRWDAWFDTYRVPCGTTPCTWRFSQTVQHFVLRLGDRFLHREYSPASDVPSEGKLRVLRVELPEKGG